MAHRGRELIGTPVRLRETGENIGQIEDMVFSSTGRVSGFVVAVEKGLIRREHVVHARLFDELQPGGAVISPEALESAEFYDTDGIRLYGQGEGLCGRSLYSEDGRVLGAVGDVVLDAPDWSLWGFEVSDGILKDLLDGRSVIEAAGAEVHGEDIYLSGERNKHMNLHSGGHATS